ncbi:MAG: hypothetical protein LBQ84_09650, partial [Flavobacteriaceae bacterium]|nr:hypothetical protein [Flavobacteriaceae bacterium]
TTSGTSYFPIGKLGDLEISYKLTGSTISPTIKNTGNTSITTVTSYNIYRVLGTGLPYNTYYLGSTIPSSSLTSGGDAVTMGNNVTNTIGLYFKFWVYNPDIGAFEFETFQVTADRMIVKYIWENN